jgi:hypothetical protein
MSFESAQRAWESPPDYAEEECEETLAVRCDNEDCDAYDVEVNATVTVQYADEYGTAYYTCPVCDVEAESQTTREVYEHSYEPEDFEDR